MLCGRPPRGLARCGDWAVAGCTGGCRVCRCCLPADCAADVHARATVALPGSRRGGLCFCLWHGDAAGLDAGAGEVAGVARGDAALHGSNGADGGGELPPATPTPWHAALRHGGAGGTPPCRVLDPPSAPHSGHTSRRPSTPPAVLGQWQPARCAGAGHCAAGAGGRAAGASPLPHRRLTPHPEWGPGRGAGGGGGSLAQHGAA